MKEVLQFETKLKTQEVVIDGNTCVITELTGDGRDTYNDYIRSRMVETGKLDKNGDPEMKVSSMKGVTAKLLSLSITNKKDGKGFAESVISQWPSSVLEKLSKVVSGISGLSDSNEEESKNG